MTQLSKRMQHCRQSMLAQPYEVRAAITALKELSTVKFNESVEVAVNLGIDPKKSDQTVRGAIVLPHGIGKTVRVAVFAQGEAALAAQKAGADQVGFDDLAELVKSDKLAVDVVIATPDAMRLVGQLGPLLGPKGLMPNPKVGTVTADVAQAVQNVKSGQVRYRADKGGIVHSIIGKLSFTVESLLENLQVLMADIQKAKPATAKGRYIKKMTLTTTMGPGLVIDPSTV